MRLKVISILFSISSFNLAALETIYKWENSNSKVQTGKCYEIDKETKGKKFFSPCLILKEFSVFP